MEKMSLINELTQGHELARQLLVHINAPSSSDGTKEFLVHKIEASYEKALSMVNCNANPALLTGGTIRMLESPPTSRCGSSPSEDSDRRFGEPELKDASKKRKSSQLSPSWTQRVRVRPGMALEGSLDDGFNWRKYGQKDILCSKYPRGYYRCTHRSVRGCLATKQVQRSDDDPTIFDITYIGTHTCTNVTSNLMSLPGHSDVKNQELDNVHHRHQTYTNSFPYTSSTSNVVFSSSPSVVDNNGVGNLSPSDFVLSTTSGTSFSFRSFDRVSGDYKIIQGAADTSATSSPVVGLDFPVGVSGQLDQNFTFENNGFFLQGP
ncbi:WRKY DNA-binding protein 30, ARABIDOPSIS THALIANA WRKY DNA-BINDING PROTEIN 30 [Hibiscus trionum]|uniref:WRKY DNA-binding protein 30, ARABIDOPSIS THALIANA WRKY DNA-BINDING PROTEIN 30 n=1 Tax=Hibiscus trionum TaxID=183268 RepID=A0A9W7MTQ0_HIBTR|nr:WRKY DNA-binding protein 30, ARABIDOPSIS THALIANA WRKY DNA-BINDING PROTEIN 30 [Hibiscus trionum]